MTPKNALGKNTKQNRRRLTEKRDDASRALSWLMEEIDVKVDDLPNGIRMCLSNSRDFLANAEILAERRHFRHCIGLIELAQEEMGKAQHFLDVFEDAILSGKRTASLAKRTFTKHLVKLAFTPKPWVLSPWVLSYSDKEYDLRSRFYSSGPILRERSFYVDLKQGQWLWGNPELEQEETTSFLVKELRIDCEMIEAGLRTALTAKEMIEKHGSGDKRTREFIRKHFGRFKTTDQV